MPQNNIKPNDRPGFSRFRPRGGGDENTPKKGPKFNIYWIWAVIAIILLGYNFLGSGFRQMHITWIRNWNSGTICSIRETCRVLYWLQIKTLSGFISRKTVWTNPIIKTCSEKIIRSSKPMVRNSNSRLPRLMILKRE